MCGSDLYRPPARGRIQRAGENRPNAAVALDPDAVFGFTYSMPRTPTSILMLVDRRARLEAELKRLQALKNESAALYRTVKSIVKSIDDALASRGIDENWEGLPLRPSTRSYARGQYGALNNIILRGVRASGGGPISSTELLQWIDLHWPQEFARPDDYNTWRKNVRRRMRHLRAQGVLVSLPKSGSKFGPADWKINETLAESSTRAADTQAIPPRADSLDSIAQTKGTGRSGEGG